MKHLKKLKTLIVYNVVFTNSAADALITQALYIFEQSQNVDIADRYLDDMKDFITATLSSFPKAGRSTEAFGAGVRKLVYQRYSVLYKIMERQIVILTIFKENLPNI